MFRQLLFTEFRPYAELSERQLSLLEEHYELLIRWNQTLNLTRIQEINDVIRFHYCESLFLGLHLPSGARRIADLGSGAGFPGIPIAVLKPEVQITLIESNQRKAVFLREASHGLLNIGVLPMRAEACRQQFDCVISRAVSLKTVLSAHLAPSWALLTSAKEAPPGSELIHVPWGENRVVSRGT